MEGGEAGETTPPLGKKVAEGTLRARLRGVGGLGGAIGLLEAATTPVMQGGVAGLVIATGLGFASFRIKLHADIVFAHEGRRDSVDIFWEREPKQKHCVIVH